MATQLNNSAFYSDQLVAWHNQRLWWLLCGSGAIIAVLAVAVCVLARRPHPAPWVLAVDAKGEPVGGVQPLMNDTGRIADETIHYDLNTYIQDAFTVSSQFAEEQTLLGKVYAMSAAQAAEAITAYYRANKDANNPLMANGKYWQDVDILRALKLPPKDTYQVDYITIRHDHDHRLDGVRTNWRATMHVVHANPTDKNLLGIFVDSLDFEPEAK